MSSTDSADDPLSDAALTRLVVRALAALVALLLASALVVVADRVDDTDDTASGADDDPALAVPARGIGPLPGQPVAAYVQARTAELSRADGDAKRVAVVSFTTYVMAADVDLETEVDVEALLVAAPGGEPSMIDVGGTRAWAASERQEAAGERTELERLLPTVDDADFERTYRDDIARLEALERDVDAAGDVVFGVVVVGRVEHLQQLASAASVRLVDLGRDAGVPEAEDVAGVRPEETDKAGEPRYRPVGQPG